MIQDPDDRSIGTILANCDRTADGIVLDAGRCLNVLQNDIRYE